MKKKIIRASIIICVVFLARVLVACCDCGSFTGRYNYNHIELYPLDNSGPTAVVSPADSIGKNSFGLRLDFAVELVAHAHNATLNPFATAMAMSCACGGTLVARSVVSTVKIITLNDFDASHPANSDITSLFQILDTRYENGEQKHIFVSIEKYFDDIPEFSIDDTIVSVDALLFTAPSIAGMKSFNAKVKLSDGRVFDLTTAPITLY